MISIVRLLLLSILTNQLAAQCSLGCLACEKASDLTFRCVVCDLHNNYALNSKAQCQKFDVANCELASADHTKSLCLECKSGFHLDTELKQCVEIPASSLIPKCTRYSSLNHCSRCEDGNYILDGICVAVTTAVTGCLGYNADGSKCVECEGLKFLKADKCEEFTAEDNCLNYSELTCDACAAGYFKELNYHSTLSLSAPIVHAIILENKNAVGMVRPPPATICHKEAISQCTKYLNFTQCEKCSSGYYVDQDRACTMNPYNKILNCYRYSDKVTCSLCNEESFLASNKCVPRTMVSNCAKYDRFSSTCIECDAAHYLSGNTCQIRAFSRRIEHCTSNNLLADECMSCKARFKLTDDKQGCLLAIENCLTYETNSRFSMTSLLCQTCRPGYYASVKKTDCGQQDVINCKAYLTNMPTCTTCDPGFYYTSADNTCLPYIQPACATYSLTSDVCLTCIKDHYESAGECKPYSVSNCKTLSTSTNTCSECEENHFLSGGDCYRYNLFGCDTPTAGVNQCTTCISGYYKKSNLCWKNNLPNCELASLTKNECETCMKGFYLDSVKYCRPLSIPNCGIFKPNLNECATNGCDVGYINSGNFCTLPYSPNCDTLTANSNLCATGGCKAGFMRDGNGYCRKQAVPFCKRHTDNTNNCAECETGYFLTSDKCLPQIMKGCIDFSTNTNLNCGVCAEGYYRLSNVCYPYTITNCLQPKTDADACEDSKCVAGFVKNPTTGNCQIAELPFCKTLVTSAYPVTCTECHIGYILSAAQCVVSNPIANCVEPDKVPDKCVLCADGFYLDTNLECQPQSAELSGKCLAFKPNSKDCMECTNGHNGVTCADNTTIASCLMSDGVTNACQMCIRGKKDISTCSAISGAELTKLDANCLGNKTTDGDTCSACKKGLTLITSFTENMFSIPNCLVLSASPRKCNQCKTNFRLTAAGLCAAPGGTAICLKKKAGDTTDLTTKANCEVCDNATKYEDGSDNCEARTVEYDDCEEYVKDSNTDSVTLCSRCKAGMAMTKTINYGYCVKRWKPDTASPTATLANCLVFSLNDIIAGSPKCVTCDNTKIMKSDNTACEAAASGPAQTILAKGITDTLLFGAVQAVVPAVTDSDSNSRRQVSKAGAQKFTLCNSGHVRRIGDGQNAAAGGNFDLGASVKITRPNYLVWSNKLGPWAHGTGVANCDDITNLSNIPKIMDEIKNADFIDAYTKEMFYNCENMVNIDTQGETCLKCKDGYNGYLVKVADKDGSTTVANPVIGLDCTAKSNLFEKRYEGLSSLSSDTEKFILDDFLQYDTCTDGGTLVVFMEVVAAQYFWSKNLPTNRQKFNSMKCVRKVPEKVMIKQCQIYILKANEDPNVSEDASYLCVACAPGFKATVAANAVTKCEPIPNCDTSDPLNNTWLNSCETCNSNSAWELDQTNKNPIYSGCHITTTSNCQLLDDNATVASKKCLVCHDGYNLTAGYLCVKVDLTNSNCSSQGREANAYMHTMSEANVSALVAANKEKYFMSAAAFLFWKYDGRFSENSFGCEACGTGYRLVSQITSDSIKACVSQWNIFVKSVDNCKEYMGNYGVAVDTKAKCRECKSGYRLAADFLTCTGNGYAFEGCMTIDGSNKCLKCETGYELYDTSGTPTCMKHGNCLAWNTASLSSSSIVCEVCVDGYKLPSATSSVCERILFTDPCITYGKFGHCLKCRNGGHPIHYKKDPYTGPIVVCTQKKHSNTFFQHASFEFDNTGLKLLDTTNVPLALFKLSTTDTAFFLAASPQLLCLPNVDVRDCVRYDGLLCVECRDGFARKDPFTCIKGNKSKCLRYDSIQRCGSCEPGFVVNSSGSCIARTGTNCLVYDKVQDICSRCQQGFYLDNSHSTRCKPRTNLMCKGFAENKDVCYECYEGYYLDLQSGAGGSTASTGKCIKKDHPGCLYSLAEANECRICDQGFYLNKLGKCMKYTFTGCEIFSPVEDKCVLCKDENYMVTASNHCKPRINLNCQQFMYYEDKCISCEDRYFRNDDKCLEYSVTGCTLFNPYANRCDACVEGLFLSSTGTCIESNDVNCELMGDYLYGCLKCLSTTFLNKTTQKCTPYTVNCDHYNQYSDECFSCPSTSYLKDGKCLPYMAKNCLAYVLFEDLCLSCNPGYFFNGNICQSIVIENCDVPNHRMNSCVICSENYFNNQGRCQVYTLLNCKMPNPGKNECYKCDPGFYLNDSSLCKPYTKTGCYGYLPNSDRCVSCIGDFFMHDGTCKPYTKTNCILRDDFADACLSCDAEHFLEGEKCLEYAQKDCHTRDKNADHCLSCKEEHFLEGFSCKDYTVKNCKTKSKYADMCLECDTNGIFRNGLGLCQNSSVVTSCMTYNKYFNRCDECLEGFFLENKVCVANPSGVPRCKEYSDEKICYHCDSSYYLNENVCLLSSVIISNCDFYSHDGICARCLPTFFLIGNECKPQTNTTCSEWSSPENCSKCAETFMINPSGSTVVCQLIGITNCAEGTFNPTGIHTCTKCIASHFLKDNTCLISTNVSECLDYSTELLCSKCNPNHILSLDKKTCDANISGAGSNCGLAHYNDTPVCSVCKSGYFFDTAGKCVVCQVQGCATCDVINNRKCKLCQPGYQMTELFYCETINAIEGGSLGDPNNKMIEDSETVKAEGSWIVGVKAYGLLAVVLALVARI